MRKKTFLPLGLVLVFLMQALLLSGASAQPTAQWTFMIYVCGDNDLEDYWPDLNLPQLESVGSTAEVHFVALVDLYTEEGCELVHIEKGYTTVVQTYPELNLGDPQVCIDFVNTVKQLYPAQKYVLDFWDHGGGWDYVCWDQGDDDWLDNPKLAQIIDAVGYMDIIAFDACDMAQISVYYEFVGKAGYLVGSEESVPGEGYPYDTDAQDLVGNPTWDAERYAVELVTNYGEYYAAQHGVDYATLSAVDASQIPALATAFTDWTSEMTANLDKYERKYTSALRGTTKMWATNWYLDMNSYMDQLLEEKIPASLVTTTQNVKTAVNNAVLAAWNGKKMTGCCGLTFYWAKELYWTGAWSVRDRYIAEVAWGTATGWAGFLDAYYGVA
ncbi:hypothetical protein GWO13_09705 [Candidatus Bathyarchaeota archaeon]|nr:hypothetical protein [Candidatus Bathyarchaeota archaeon]